MIRRGCAPRWSVVAVLLSSLVADWAWLEARQAAAPPRAVDLVVIVSVDDAEARPLRRANVLLQGSPIESARVAVTDDDGRAVFRELPPGSYTLFADRVGYVRTFHGGRTPGRGPGVPLAVVAGEPVEPVRLRMLRGGAIGGTVRSPSGAPIRGQVVELTAIRTIEGTMRAVAPERRGSGVFTGDIHRTTDDRGVYRFSGLAPGHYLVSVPGLGAVSQAVQLIGEGELRWADAVVTAQRTGATVPPVPDTSPVRRSTTMHYPGVADPADAQVIELGVAEEREGIDIVMQWLPTSRVSGRLLDDQGRPQPNVAISIRRARPDPFSLFQATSPTSGGRSQADGTFTLENVLPGEYQLVVRAMLRDGAMPPATQSAALSVAEMFALSGASSTGVTHWAEQTISVRGQDLSGVTLALQRAMIVTGRLVYDAASRSQPSAMAGTPIALVPLPDVAVLPEQARAIMTRGTIRGRVDAAGEFAIAGVPPGRYRLDVGGGLLEAEEAIAVAAGGWLVKSVMAGGRDVADVPLEIRPGEDVAGVVVTFTDRPASLMGRVFDGAERPVSQYPIVVFSTNRSHWTPASRRVRLIQPASNGAFEAAGLPAGEYFVVAVAAADSNDLYDVAFLDQLAASAFRIGLAEGERKLQDLRLK